MSVSEERLQAAHVVADEDKELAVAFKGGDEGAYDHIYARHSERVENICRRMLRDPHDAAEAAQETFLRVYKALPRFNGRYQLGAWIARIATNVCLDHLRAKGRRPVDPAPLEDLEIDIRTPEGRDPEAVALQKADTRRVRRVLDKLPPTHRAAIILRDFEGLSYSEVAIVLGITECQTKALIHRARQGFKKTWIQGLASVFLPTRLIHRMRGVETVRDAAPGALQVSQHVALNCSAALQQCGVFMAERAAAVATVAVVGTGAVAGGMALGSRPVDHRAAAPAAKEPSIQQESRSAKTPATSNAGRGASGSSGGPAPAGAEERTSASSTVPAVKPPPEGEMAGPQEPAPAPQPTPGPGSEQPAPQPTQPGTTQPPKDREGATGPTPAAPQEPAGFSFAASWSGPAPASGCTQCLRDAASVSSRQYTTSDGVFVFDHKARGNMNAGGQTAFGFELDHSADDGRHHALRAVVFTDEGGYSLSGSGVFASSSATAWGGTTYTYEGSYALGSRPSKKEPVPTRGTYSLTVTYSGSSDRIVNVSLTFTESS